MMGLSYLSLNLIKRAAGLARAMACVMALGTAPLAADPLAPPQGEVLLQISGSISVSSDGEVARFDRAMLEELGADTIETLTIWTEGPQVFKGVALADLMEAVGAEGETIKATAINDYAIEIPMTDAAPGFAMIAYERNGAPMSRRGKGPLWLIYPFDSDARFRSGVYHSRSIWQLDRLEVLR